MSANGQETQLNPLIVKVNRHDTKILEQIADIAKELTIPANISGEALERWCVSGFLVSGYTVDEYTSFAVRRHFYAMLTENVVASFLLGYSENEPVAPNDFGSRFIRERFGKSNIIIKQIGTSPSYMGRGYARLLYGFLHQVPKSDLYAAIVKSPPNRGSERFHKALGFEECATFEHPDTKPRGIWRKTFVGDSKPNSIIDTPTDEHG